MPVLIRGIFSGGGKIKDATAWPRDVRSGKVFYNNQGRQIGNWKPSATDYTGDATALPEDVVRGKIFYNSQGRKVGTKEFLEEKTTSITIDKSMRYDDLIDDYYPMLSLDPDGGNLSIGQGSVVCRYRKQINLQYNTILYFYVNGQKYNIPWAIIPKIEYFQILDPTKKPNAWYGNFSITFDQNKNIYLGMDDESKYESITFVIHYI